MRDESAQVHHHRHNKKAFNINKKHKVKNSFLFKAPQSSKYKGNVFQVLLLQEEMTHEERMSQVYGMARKEWETAFI